MARLNPRRGAGSLALLALLAACTVNPATGQRDFTPFMSPARERSIGAEEHPKLVAQFGGEYGNRRITAYVDAIGKRLHRVSEMSGQPFKFTVVNSDIVNAFALPGGYVHISRGVLALANSEAELAGVLAHEIGHITARHTAQRISQAMIANLGVAALGAASGSSEVARIGQLGAGAYLSSYSREQELESDMLGIRYLSRAGYDPDAMERFLVSMGRDSDLRKRIAGSQQTQPYGDIFATHPRTPERVAQAARISGAARPAAVYDGHEDYLSGINGMLFGDDPAQGFVRGRVFAHPKMRFRFEVPPGFRLHNSAKSVIAKGPDGAIIIFDGATYRGGRNMAYYLTRVWVPRFDLKNVEPLTINGLAAASGSDRLLFQGSRRDIRFVAIRFGDTQIYRFVFITPPRRTAALSRGLQRTTYSFRRLRAAEAAALKPLRVRAVRVGQGDNVATLARRMAFDSFRVERFRVLNGLGPNDRLRPGQLVKIVSE